MSDHPAKVAFSHWLLTGTIVHHAHFETMQEQYQVSVHPQLIMLISIDRYFEICIGRPFLWRREIAIQLSQVIQKVVSIPYLTIWVEEGVMALLLELPKPSYEHPEQLYSFTHPLAEQVIKGMADQGVSVSIGIGGFYSNPYLLHLSYQEARKSMIHRFFQGNQLIFHYQEEEKREIAGKSPLTNEERTELQALVRIADEEGVISLLQLMLKKLAVAHYQDVEVFKSEVTDLIMLMTRVALENGGNMIDILSRNAALIQDLYHTIRYDHFVKKVSTYARQLVAQIDMGHLGKVSTWIRKALDYMRANLHQKITLVEVAQYCSMSHYYFSRKFKEELGISFIEYLNQLRIKKAFYYLEQTDWTIQQIAEAIGFDDANYFSRLFKRYQKQTPTEYRRAKLY
ncbi:two-component system, response regulator YesN [Seinonella peptonophila]|uniref:Two-component system, response regulator YesN n=1 Tax=Seinonella peptonophila TaxID=112248 RepID=A0A1M4W8S8_9BACL|nr:helix-turn-helix domain-containing protein [Seinonella peptonophila]SHE77644.1 two-component system, response regulator YesN [Seinonella peptonophila]